MRSGRITRPRATNVATREARAVDQMKLTVVSIDVRHRAAQLVAVADEVRDELIAWRFVEPVDCVELLHDALVEHGNAVRHGQRLALIVRHVDKRHAEFFVQ
jgi:hypothetical protein